MLSPPLLRFNKHEIFHNNSSYYVLYAKYLMGHIIFLVVNFTAIQKFRYYYSNFIVEKMGISEEKLG